MYAFYYKFDRIPYRNLIKMRVIEVIIITLCIYLLVVLWLLYYWIAIEPFNVVYNLVLIDSEMFNEAANLGYNAIWISVGVNIIIVFLYYKFQSLTKQSVMRQDLKDTETVQKIKDSMDMERVGSLRNQQIMRWALILSILSNIAILNYFPRKLLLFPSYVMNEDSEVINVYFEYQLFSILMVVLFAFSSITLFNIIFYSVRQIKDINGVIIKKEKSDPKLRDNPLKRMPYEQRYKIKIMVLEEEVKLHEISRRKKLIKAAENDQKHNLTIKPQIESDKFAIEQAEEIIKNNIDKLKQGEIPPILELEDLLLKIKGLEKSEPTDLKTAEVKTEAGSADESKMVDELIKEQVSKKMARDKKKADKKKSDIEKYDFR